MLTYISLLIGMASAIVGVLLSPRTKGIDGAEHLNRWVILFIALPLVSFGVAATQYCGETQAKVAAESKLESLISKSADRVDAFVVQVTHSVYMTTLSERAKQLIHKFPVDGAAIQNKDGKYIYGIYEGMFGGDSDDMPAEVREMFKLINDYVKSISRVAPHGTHSTFTMHGHFRNEREARKAWRVSTWANRHPNYAILKRLSRMPNGGIQKEWVDSRYSSGPFQKWYWDFYYRMNVLNVEG